MGRVELERIESKEENYSRQEEEIQENKSDDYMIIEEDSRCLCASKDTRKKVERRASVFNFQEYSKQQNETRKLSVGDNHLKVCHSDAPVPKPPPGYRSDGSPEVGNSYVLEPAEKFDAVKVKKIVVEELEQVKQVFHLYLFIFLTPVNISILVWLRSP